MLSSGTWPHRPFRDVTARPRRQTSLTRTNKPKITNYSCRISAAALKEVPPACTGLAENPSQGGTDDRKQTGRNDVTHELTV
jgi:hypothetical protein